MARPLVYTWPASNTTLIAPLQTIVALNTIALLQNTAGAANLTLNGSYVNGAGVALISGPPQTISITSANDLSLVTFTLIGTDIYGNKIGETLAGPNVATVYSTLSYSTITGVSTNIAANGITVGAVAPLALTSSVFIYPGISRAVSLTSANNLSAARFVVTGTLNGAVVSQSNITGPNVNTVYTTQIFDTVTMVTVNTDVAAVSIGSGLLGATHWFLYNYDATVVGLTAQVIVNATTVSYSFQTTLDDVQTNASPTTFTPIAAMTTGSTSQFAPYNNVLRYSRIAVLTGTNATGALTATFVEQGIT